MDPLLTVSWTVSWRVTNPDRRPTLQVYLSGKPLETFAKLTFAAESINSVGEGTLIPMETYS